MPPPPARPGGRSPTRRRSPAPRPAGPPARWWRRWPPGRTGEGGRRGATSTSVAHAGVLHAQHRSLLVGGEAGVDHLAHEEGVAASGDRVHHAAVEPGGGGVEDGRAGGPLVVALATYGSGGGVVFGRLHEPAHQ